MTKRFPSRPFSAMVMTAALLAIAACSTSRTTEPDQSATEQLLITKAADQAIEQLRLPLPTGTKVYLETSGIEGEFAAYAKAAIRAQIVEQGGYLVTSREAADTVVDVRAGALSIDAFGTLVGMPSFNVPIPLAGETETPEIALYKRAERRGIAKVAATAYSADEGKHIASSGQKYGFSQKREWTVLIFFSWENDDLIPEHVEPSKRSLEFSN